MELSEIVKIWEVVQVFHRYSPFQKVAILLGAPIAIYVIYLTTIGRPPLVVHDLRFVMLQDGQVRSLPGAGSTVELEFRLLNSSSPPAEIRNVFGQLWIDGAHFASSSLQPSRGSADSARVEWDMQIPVLPKEAAFLPTKIVARLPPPDGEIAVGAQLVSTETSKQEYLWRVVNDSGTPRVVFVRNPHGDR